MAKTLAQTKRELESLISHAGYLTESEMVDLSQSIRSIDLELKIQDREAERSRLLSDYGYFFRQAWEQVESARLLFNWHHKLQCDYFQSLFYGDKFRDLVMNVPPGTTKSVNSMVIWPAWVYANCPTERIMTASFDLNLVAKQSMATKDIINSDWYQAFFGDRVSISPRNDTQTYWETTAGGWRFATTPKSKALGRHPSIILVDDPQNVKQVDSERERPAVNDWWDKTMISRGAGKTLRRRRAIIMQRLHEKDLTGHVMSTGVWTHLCLPMRYEPNRMADIGLGADPRTTDGELLWPEMFDEATVKEAERSLGMDAAGQLQQRPMAKGGGIFKTDRFRFIPLAALPVKTIRRFKRAFDKAATPDAGCFTAGVLGGIEYTLRNPNAEKKEFDETVYIIDVVRNQWGSGDVELQIDLWSRVDNAQYGDKYETIFEREGGSAGIQAADETTRRLRGRRIRAISTGGKSKPIRWNGLANAIYRREVVLVEAAWNTAFIHELQNIPKGEYKDQADAASLMYSELVDPSAMDSMDDDDEATENFTPCANNGCDRLAAIGAEYCCKCCEAGHSAGVELRGEQHEPTCNLRHNQLAARGEWEPNARLN